MAAGLEEEARKSASVPPPALDADHRGGWHDGTPAPSADTGHRQAGRRPVISVETAGSDAASTPTAPGHLFGSLTLAGTFTEQGHFTLTDSRPDGSSWERGCPARKWDGKTAANRCGRDTSVPRTPASAGGAVPGPPPLRFDRTGVPPHEPIPQRGKVLTFTGGVVERTAEWADNTARRGGGEPVDPGGRPPMIGPL